jgi:hypothetical protein
MIDDIRMGLDGAGALGIKLRRRDTFTLPASDRMQARGSATRSRE